MILFSPLVITFVLYNSCERDTSEKHQNKSRKGGESAFVEVTQQTEFSCYQMNVVLISQTIFFFG